MKNRRLYGNEHIQDEFNSMVERIKDSVSSDHEAYVMVKDICIKKLKDKGLEIHSRVIHKKVLELVNSRLGYMDRDNFI